MFYWRGLGTEADNESIACSFCFLSPTTPPAPSRHHFRKSCPVTRNQGVLVWGILRPFSFVLSFYFLSSSKKQTGVNQSTLFPVQSVRNEAKKPGGLHTRPGLGGLGGELLDRCKPVWLWIDALPRASHALASSVSALPTRLLKHEGWKPLTDDRYFKV